VKDHRNGRDVKPDDVKKTFGFADIGFGTWVGSKQDQDHLDYAYDAFMDLADELNRRGIALCLYVHPTDQHDLSRKERALFGWGPEVDGLPGPRLGLWPNPKWDAFILGLFKEISLRYGERVSGYWIDRHTPKRFEDAGRMAVALRAGNPDAVIWQSGPDYVQDGLSLEDAWPAAESGYTDRGEKDQCCIMPTGDWMQGTEVKIPATELLRVVARCAGTPGQKGGMKAIGDMNRLEVVKELQERFGSLSRADSSRVLKEIDALAVQVGCRPGKIPARAALALLRRTGQQELALP
jgi:hypothetical protein